MKQLQSNREKLKHGAASVTKIAGEKQLKPSGDPGGEPPH